jgi:cytochrome c-type biogenesis protein CcmH/NrfG
LARALVAQGQASEAAVHYRRALELDPNNALARQELEKLLRGNARPPAP